MSGAGDRQKVRSVQEYNCLVFSSGLFLQAGEDKRPAGGMHIQRNAGHRQEVRSFQDYNCF
jgi:hypothetical protein